LATFITARGLKITGTVVEYRAMATGTAVLVQTTSGRVYLPLVGTLVELGA
jgi:hypothetical protein